jgi:hypothetical protein
MGEGAVRVDVVSAWSSRWLCYVCKARATVRVFSGAMGGGWPACDEHRGSAEDEALKPLSRRDLAEGYTVKAYADRSRRTKTRDAALE